MHRSRTALCAARISQTRIAADRPAAKPNDGGVRPRGPIRVIALRAAGQGALRADGRGRTRTGVGSSEPAHQSRARGRRRLQLEPAHNAKSYRTGLARKEIVEPVRRGPAPESRGPWIRLAQGVWCSARANLAQRISGVRNLDSAIRQASRWESTGVELSVTAVGKPSHEHWSAIASRSTWPGDRPRLLSASSVEMAIAAFSGARCGAGRGWRLERSGAATVFQETRGRGRGDSGRSVRRFAAASSDGKSHRDHVGWPRKRLKHWSSRTPSSRSGGSGKLAHAFERLDACANASARRRRCPGGADGRGFDLASVEGDIRGRRLNKPPHRAVGRQPFAIHGALTASGKNRLCPEFALRSPYRPRAVAGPCPPSDGPAPPAGVPRHNPSTRARRAFRGLSTHDPPANTGAGFRVMQTVRAPRGEDELIPAAAGMVPGKPDARGAMN